MYKIPPVTPPPTVSKINKPVDLNELQVPKAGAANQPLVNGLPVGSHAKAAMDFTPGEKVYPHQPQKGPLLPKEVSESRRNKAILNNLPGDISAAKHVVLDLKIATKDDKNGMGPQLVREDDISYKVKGNIEGPGKPLIDLGKMIRFREQRVDVADSSLRPVMAPESSESAPASRETAATSSSPSVAKRDVLDDIIADDPFKALRIPSAPTDPNEEDMGIPIFG